MSDAMPLSDSVRALTLMKEALSLLDHAGHLGVAAALQNAIDIAVAEIDEAAD